MSKSSITKTDIMFEKIKEQIDKLPELIVKQLSKLQIATPIPKLDTSSIETVIRQTLKESQNKGLDSKQDNAEVLSRLEELNNAIQGQKQQSKRIHHRISIDIASSKTFLAIIAMGIMIIVSCLCIYQQREKIKSLSDNDLKYRYIKAYNQIDSINLVQLEDVFEYNRKPELIKRLRKDVERFERDVVDRATRLEEARLKEKKAEVLQQEADKLKK